ncbi:MAG: helix-turn-helix domain-containing protein [Lachnospiraceae bacterium]|nr:helix-turn-helix domain-containing protein [Lachnospiraceae bacterium]
MAEEQVYLRNMRSLRENAKYTQEEVSEKLNIQRATYCNYEQGYRLPPLDIIIRLARLYNVSVDYLLCCTSEEDIPANYRHLCTSERRLLENVCALTANSQKEVWQFIYFKKKYPS